MRYLYGLRCSASAAETCVLPPCHLLASNRLCHGAAESGAAGQFRLVVIHKARRTPHHEPQQPTRFQNGEPAEGDFQIAGIHLDVPRPDFAQIRSKFGDGTEVKRGDAASGRNQICYVSAAVSVHLIFEFGEINSVLFLFEGGPTWNGSELCSRSDAVSPNRSTCQRTAAGKSLRK